MKHIYIIRHGETDLNRNGIVQGSGVDADLNELGRNQARAFFNWYADQPFEVILTSTLRRTHQTVWGFIEKGTPWEKWAEINEISWGTHEGLPNTPKMKEEYNALIRDWKAGKYDSKISGGESAEDLARRMQRFVEHLKGRTERTILVCTHGRAMRSLICVIKGLPLYEMEQTRHANTGLYKIGFDGKAFHFELENDLQHLGDLPSL